MSNQSQLRVTGPKLPTLAVRLEWMAAIVATIAIIFAHLLNGCQAGGLWRDEAHTAALAQVPSITEICNALHLDSFPLLSTVVFRVWSSMERLSTDAGLRALGCMIGLAIILVYWCLAWDLHRGPPTLAIMLWGANAGAIRFGDAVRPYGVGILALLLAFWLIWLVVNETTPLRVVGAVLFAILSVQSLYQSAFFIGAFVLASALVALRRRRWKQAALAIAIGVAAAVSLLPYISPIRAASDWSVIVFRDVDSQLFVRHVIQGWYSLQGALGIGVTMFAVVVAIGRQKPSRRQSKPMIADLALYCVAAMIFATIATLGFYWNSALLPQPWHYLLLIALIAACADNILGGLSGGAFPRVSCLLAAMLISGHSMFDQLRERNTNVDVIAYELNATADSRDLIVVNPWYCAVTLSRYYRGQAPVVTLPPLDEVKVHRYDLIKRQMMTSQPLTPIFDLISITLEAGHRVWIVGELTKTLPGRQMPDLPPAPQSEYRWRSGAYISLWETQTGDFLSQHALRSETIAIPLQQSVAPFENAKLIAIDGWRP